MEDSGILFGSLGLHRDDHWLIAIAFEFVETDQVLRELFRLEKADAD